MVRKCSVFQKTKIMCVTFRLSALNGSVRVGAPCDQITVTKTTPTIKAFMNFISLNGEKGRYTAQLLLYLTQRVNFVCLVS